MLPALTNASAALLILKPAGPANAIQPDPSQTATDRLTAIINGISSEDSPSKTKAASKITSSLLDQQEATDSLVGKAVKLIDSKSVVFSDPALKEVLKDVVNGNAGEFAANFRKELAEKPGITEDNALINALTATIRKHRDRFGDGEFVFGAKLANGGGIFTSFEDKNGRSTDKDLARKASDIEKQIDEFLKSPDPNRDPADFRKRLGELGSAFQAAVRERYDYWATWADALGLKTR